MISKNINSNTFYVENEKFEGVVVVYYRKFVISFIGKNDETIRCWDASASANHKIFSVSSVNNCINDAFDKNPNQKEVEEFWNIYFGDIFEKYGVEGKGKEKE